VRPDVVDHTAHTGLVALPEELRACTGRVRELRVRRDALEALPAWLGELTGLTELRVGGSRRRKRTLVRCERCLEEGWKAFLACRSCGCRSAQG
jgi:hypothetical protein